VRGLCSVSTRKYVGAEKHSSTHADPYLPIDPVPPLRLLSRLRADSSVSYPYESSSCTRKVLVVEYNERKLLLDQRGFPPKRDDTLLCEKECFAMSDGLRGRDKSMTDLIARQPAQLEGRSRNQRFVRIGREKGREGENSRYFREELLGFVLLSESCRVTGLSLSINLHSCCSPRNENTPV